MVETVDVITPLVDDPFTFGKIAAANALSDVYAMGGRPVTAMNLVFFPSCSVAPEVLKEMLAGGQSILKQASVCMVGGHTVEDDELKYGLSVTGLIHPDEIIRNSTTMPGDILILTKPLGSGIISTAIKGDLASSAAIEELTGWGGLLNLEASLLMKKCHATAATDVTGFGLIGHLCEMAKAAGVTIVIDLNQIPLMSDVNKLVAEGMVPAGCYRNRDYYQPLLSKPDNYGDQLLPLFDPQTSGGLLISLSPENGAEFIKKGKESNLFARIIGRVKARESHLVELK